jgi:glycosyltransferase involved in cell wall biosynthesis
MWPEGGGGTLATHLILKLLAQCGFDILVVTGTRNPARVKGIVYVYHPFLKFSNKLRLWTYLTTPSVKSWFTKLIKKTDIVYIPRYCYPSIPLAKKQGKRVVVHIHDYQPISYNATVFHNPQKTGFFASFNEEVRYELLEHASILRTLLASPLIPLNRLSEMWLAESDNVICVSRAQADIIACRAPKLAEKIKVIYNLLPDVPYAEKNYENCFLFVGGGGYAKGFYTLLSASRKLLSEDIKAQFLLCGDFIEANMLFIRKLNETFKDAYTIMGHLRHEETLKLHNISRALILPSLCEEPLSYATLEAMLLGTIPIASRVGGVPEIVQGTYAEKMLFAPGNTEELTDKMRIVSSFSTEELINIGGELRQKTLRRFDREKVKDKLLEVFYC